MPGGHRGLLSEASSRRHLQSMGANVIDAPCPALAERQERPQIAQEAHTAVTQRVYRVGGRLYGRKRSCPYNAVLWRSYDRLKVFGRPAHPRIYRKVKYGIIQASGQ